MQDKYSRILDFPKFIFKRLRKNRGKIIWSGIVLLCLISISNIIVIKSTQHQIYDELSEVPPKEVALVLGCNKESRNGINPFFKYRMEAAAELYLNGKVKKILVSGDNHISSYDEPSDMTEYLINLGVPEEDIIQDYAGFRTFDSVIRAKKVFNCKELIIVSQKFHNQRALFIANHFDIDAVAYNAKGTPSTLNLTNLREIMAKFKVILDIYVLNTQPKFLGSAL